MWGKGVLVFSCGLDHVFPLEAPSTRRHCELLPPFWNVYKRSSISQTTRIERSMSISYEDVEIEGPALYRAPCRQDPPPPRGYTQKNAYVEGCNQGTVPPGETRTISFNENPPPAYRVDSYERDDEGKRRKQSYVKKPHVHVGIPTGSDGFRRGNRVGRRSPHSETLIDSQTPR